MRNPLRDAIVNALSKNSNYGYSCVPNDALIIADLLVAKAKGGDMEATKVITRNLTEIGCEKPEKE